MGKARGILVYTVVSAVYAIAVLNMTGVGSRVGRSGLRNYLLRGTAFLPMGIAALILMGALVHILMSGGLKPGMDSRRKGALGAAGLILLAMAVFAVVLSGKTIAAYRMDKAGGPRYAVIREAILRRKPAGASLHTIGSIGYTLKGVDEEGKVRYFYLSRKDVEGHGLLEETDYYGVDYYPESGVVAGVQRL